MLLHLGIETDAAIRVAGSLTCCHKRIPCLELRPNPCFLIRFCPFRFLHGDRSKDTASASPSGVAAEQPIPAMFGLGRHMCPGRELAKLEMIMFLKSFLTKFDYELVEGQSVKGVLPSNGPKDKLRVVLKPKVGV